MIEKKSTMQDTQGYWHAKSAVVTGGARGQGASVARMLLEAGAHVHVMDCLPATDSAWQELSHYASAQPGTLHLHNVDIAQTDAWDSVEQQLRDNDIPLYALVNNAGITGPRDTVTKASLADWQRVMGVNLTGAFLGIKTLAPLMPAGAAIVNVSSTVGMTGYYSAAYSTSKWALRGLTKSASLELATAGIRVNCVMPGVVDTDMIRANTALVAALQSIIPMQYMAVPDQIAAVMFFLLGPQASYVTGADVAVDGGVTSGGTYWPVGRAIGVV
jgi:3alpha(or 20beta)-hydroxysteroid dehydrogenase